MRDTEPADPIAAAYVDLTVAIVTLQEQVKQIAKAQAVAARAQLDEARNMSELLKLHERQIALLRQVAELLEDEAR